MEDVCQTNIAQEIARSTYQLAEVLERGGLDVEGADQLNKRITEITVFIQEHPVRVATDMSKSIRHRTEHDKERAHMIASAINECKGGKAKLNALRWGRTAGEIYDDDPVGAHPEMIRYWRIIIGNTISKQLFNSEDYEK